MHGYSTDPVVLHCPWWVLRTVIHDHSVKRHAGPLTSSRLSLVGLIQLSLGIKQTDIPTYSQTLRDFLAISFLSSADVAGLHFFSCLSTWFTIIHFDLLLTTRSGWTSVQQADRSPTCRSTNFQSRCSVAKQAQWWMDATVRSAVYSESSRETLFRYLLPCQG